MNPPKPIRWLGIQQGEQHSLEIPPGGLFVATFDAPHLGGCLTAEQLEWLVRKPAGALPWLEPSQGYFGPARFVRLVGDGDAVRLGERIFAALGIRVANPACLPPGPHQIHFMPGEGRIRAPRVAPRKTRVLVVDDSAAIRKLLTAVISRDPQLECVGAVALPSQVEPAIVQLKPDVITLDIHMPEMTGVELLKQLLPVRPLPVVMITSLSREEGGLVLDALAAGAVDYIQKPSFEELEEVAPILCEKIRNAALAKIQKVSRNPRPTPAKPASGLPLDLDFLTVIGASTGGTEAIREILTRLPAEIPPILICQHIPATFSKAFAERLAQLCAFEVREAQAGDLVRSSQVLIAPGGQQMRVERHGTELRIAIDPPSSEHRHNPSVDVLFESVCRLNLKRVAAAVLTGMGNDGARGLRALRDSGARTFTQDEASCVVYGMPREAFLKLGSEKVLPLNEIAPALLRTWSRTGRTAQIA